MFEVGVMILTSLHVKKKGSDQMFEVGVMISTCLPMFEYVVSIKCITRSLVYCAQHHLEFVMFPTSLGFWMF